MLQLFRKFFHSSIGVFSALALVGLIALAFAAGDVANMNNSGGITGGDRVAIIGSTKVGTAQLTKQAQQSLEMARQQEPTLTMKSFVAQGGVDLVLNQMIDREAMAAFGAQTGVIAGKRLVDSELAKIPAFQGAGGKFDEAAYHQLLAQRQLSDSDVRDDIGKGLIARQLLAPTVAGAMEPQTLVAQYAALLKEHRTGSIALLPSAAFAPKTAPTPAEIAAWYGAHLSAYAVPERRVIRYARFDESVVKAGVAPTDAEIAARYASTKAQYAASEQRRVSQLIVMSESMAKDIAAAVAKGATLEAAAKARGLSVAAIGPITHDALATQSSAAVADAAFAATKGTLAAPAKGSLGWALVRVDGIDVKAARSLDQAKGEIAAALGTEKRRAALAALTGKIDEQFGKGGALSDAAKDLGVTLTDTGSITADGQVFGKAGETVPKDLAAVIKAAFAMEREKQPQITELVAGKSFVIFDVARIDTAAPAPLDQIRPQVAADVALAKGATAAKIAALKVLAAGKKGADLAPTIAGLGVALPPVQPVSMGREQIAAQGGRIPAPLSLLFGMAQNTTKLLPAPGNRGWFVVQLQQITPGTLAANDPLMAQVGNELGKLSGKEQADALRRAIRVEVKVKRNETAVRSVITQLSGSN